MRKGADEWWPFYLFIASLVSFFTGFTKIYSFGVVGENITLNMRRALYAAIVKKNIGWFDARDNAPGILTSVLASEAQLLNGASTEGLSVVIESLVAIICGITLGFIMSWRLALVTLGCVPFLMLGGAINAKMNKGY